MSINYKDWFKFGAIEGILEIIFVYFMLYIGFSTLLESAQALFSNAEFTNTIMSLTIFMAILGGIYAMLGRVLYKILNLKLKGFMKYYFILTAPSIIYSLFEGTFDFTGIVLVLFAGLFFTWIAIKTYKLLKWRLPQ